MFTLGRTLGWDHSGEGEKEAAATARLGFDPRPTALQLCQTADERQPKPSARVATREGTIKLDERLEKERQLVGQSFSFRNEVLWLGIVRIRYPWAAFSFDPSDQNPNRNSQSQSLAWRQ